MILLYGDAPDSGIARLQLAVRRGTDRRPGREVHAILAVSKCDTTPTHDLSIDRY